MLGHEVTLIDPNGAADCQRRIVRELNSRGMTYDVIAKMFGVDRGASLRSYVVSDRPPRRDNKILKKIHEAMMRRDSGVSAFVEAGDLEQYAREHGAKSPDAGDLVTYRRRRDEVAMPAENMVALSEILHDIYGRSSETEFGDLRRFRGRYYAYSADPDGEHIIKGYLEVRVVEDPGFYVEFDYVVADAYSELIPELEGGQAPKPAMAHGIVFKVGHNIHFVGNQENGQAAVFFSIKEPARSEIRFAVGFIIGSSGDRSLSSSRILMVRDESARIDQVENRVYAQEHAISKFFRDTRGGFRCDSSHEMIRRATQPVVEVVP